MNEESFFQWLGTKPIRLSKGLIEVKDSRFEEPIIEGRVTFVVVFKTYHWACVRTILSSCTTIC